MDQKYPMRANKYLSQRGLATRREADELIRRKKVLVNGQPIELGYKIERDDKVEVIDNEKRIASKDYFLYFKGPDESTNDEKGPLINFLKKTGTFVANQLEKETEGLLILTNDGRLTDKLLNGNYEREYFIETLKPYHPSIASKIEAGVLFEGLRAKPAKVKENDEVRFNITIREEKRHQLKRMLIALDCEPHIIRASQMKSPAKNWEK
jgi:pseudouridine synthase